MARRRRAGGAGESGSLEAWMLGSLAFSLYNYFACRPLVGRSVLRGRGRFGPLGLHALFSVLQGAKAPFPCRGVGQRPTPLQSAKIPFVNLCGPSCTFVSAPQGEPSTHSHRFAVARRGVSNQLICQSAGWRSHPLCLRGYRHRTGSTAVSRSWWVLGSKTRPIRWIV